MSTQKGITYAQVADAANTIKARGHEPTGYAIRAELGGTGSFTTIQQHLARWKQETAEKVTTKELPPEVENAMHQAIATAWNVATKVADETTAKVRQACDDQLKQKDKELSEAHQLIAELEAKMEDAKKWAAEAGKSLTKYESDLHTLQGAHKELQARFDDLVGIKRQAEGTVAVLDTKRARSHKPAPAAESKQA